MWYRHGLQTREANTKRKNTTDGKTNPLVRPAVRVERLALEECVLGTVRERILVPDVVLSAAEQAVTLVLAEIRREPLVPTVVREVVLERVRQMRAAFDGSEADRRGAFRALLGDRRMSVAPHPDRGFQVEGLFELPLKPGRVAGGGDLTATRMFGSGGGAPYDCRLKGSRACSLNGHGRREES